MEFNEKLQLLRKQKGLTQEELAAQLFVSRTAVSKWESGRGYPNIDSLKAIAKFFSVTIDELLSGEEALTIAEEDHQQKQQLLRDKTFGLLDLSAVLFFFLPFFGQSADGTIRSVSLLTLSQIQPYLKTAYLAVAVALVLLGIAALALQNCGCTFWAKNKIRLSLSVNAAGVLLWIIGRQPYAAAFSFAFLAIKAMTRSVSST